MPKNLFQDMVKINHNKREVTHKIDKKPEIKQVEVTFHPKERRHSLWLVAVVAVVFFFFALSYLFSKAEVIIDPKAQDVVLNENLSADLNANNGNLSFDLVVISGDESQIVAATEEKEVSEKAKGTVIIYNAFSSKPQALDIDTRLEGTNGKIYKTEKKISVPGMAKDGTPGSVEVKIYGAEAGEAYNSAPLDFKIFGFKGTPKYAKFYARSKGDIVGGFKGKSHVVSSAEKDKAVITLKDALKSKLLKQATDQIPSGFILFKDAIFMSIDDVADVLLVSPNDTLPLKLKGTLYGLLFEEKELANKIAKDTIEKYDESEVYVSNMQDLKFSLNSPASSSLASFKDLKNITFNLSGNAKIVWKLDVDKLTTELLGKSKKDFYQVLLQYPNVNSANLSLRPLWKRSIPDKTEDIKIIVNYPN